MNKLIHLALIPDGNRRWAKKRGLSSSFGHQYAAEKTLPKLIDKLIELKIKYFTFWALSTENLKKRSKKELDFLFFLMRRFLKEKKEELVKKNIKFKTIGDITKLPGDLQNQIKILEKETKNNDGLVLILAINYGGRDEIIRAIKKIKEQKFNVDNLNKENFGKFLDTLEIPDPDFIIRTGGEKRLSGFMLWQSEYSELYFTDTFFPDFSPSHLEKAIKEFNNRQRRFGK